MTKNLNATLTVVLLGAAGLVLTLLLRPGTSAPEPGGSAATDGVGRGATAQQAAPQVAPEILVRPDSHRLSTAADGKVTFVEFLDFECEACGAVYPVVEDLRTDYGDRVTFVVRYFPLPGHTNAENAAVAVEAAAQQGAFEAMYQRMYQTQPDWGDQQESKAPLFRSFAADLGLDLAAYDRAVADPATLERVRKDVADGVTAGVQGTPTFFLNGARVEPRSVQELRTALDDALTR